MSRSANVSSESEQSEVSGPSSRNQRAIARESTDHSVRPVIGTLKRAGSPAFACDGHWEELVRLVWSEYAFSTMYGVNIVDGNVLSYNNVQRNLTFGPGGDERTQRPIFDDYWRALQALCLKIGTGRLAEIRFLGGRPISARTDEGGRRLKRLNFKKDEQLDRWVGKPS